MKCHIQLNQGWMNNFQNNVKDGKQTYCLSLPDLKITSEKIRTLGTLKDYYVPDIENFYNSNYERRFGQILHNIIKNVKTTTTYFVLTNDDKEFIQRFIAINISRNPITNILSDLKSSLPFKFVTPPGILSLAVHQENYKYFDGYKIRFLYNNTNTGFILPSYCHYRIIEDDKSTPIAIIPINEKIAIVFDNNACVEFSVTTITDESTIINKFNYSAFVVEAYTNCQYLISKKEKPLLDLQSKYSSSIS